MNNGRVAAFAVLFLLGGVSPHLRADDDAWAAFRYLVGDWEADGGSGKGTGRFSFAFDLQGKVLVRKNHAELPAASGRAAAKHDDLMVIYREPGGKRFRAVYFDNEDHVIHYTVTASADKRTLTFLSDPLPSTPRFRLTYERGEAATTRITFEFAPPGKPEAFQKYLEGSARRQDGKER